jgi:hypothetical protein
MVMSAAYNTSDMYGMFEDSAGAEIHGLVSANMSLRLKLPVGSRSAVPSLFFSNSYSTQGSSLVMENIAKPKSRD